MGCVSVSFGVQNRTQCCAGVWQEAQIWFIQVQVVFKTLVGHLEEHFPHLV